MSAASILAASPERLRAAASKIGNASQGLSSRATTVESAVEVAGGAWTGFAATMFRSHCSHLSADARAGTAAFGRAADALSELASSLEYAQQLARESQALAASAAALRAQASSMEPSPMIRLVTEEAYAASSRGASLEAEADRIAREAATRAASTLTAIAGAAPSRRDRAWGGVMRLSAADLTAYLNLRTRTLPDRVQEHAGRLLAQMFGDEVADGEWNEAEVGALLDALAANGYDGDLTAAFFNELGSAATAQFVVDLQVRYGALSAESERFSTPLSIALGTASTSGHLDEGFVDGLIDHDYGVQPSLHVLAQLVEHGTYDADFIVKIGEQVVLNIAHDLTSIGDIVPTDGEFVFTDVRSVILHAVARTPDAARELLLMNRDETHGLPYTSYMKILMAGQYMGPETGVGALLTAATVNVPPEDRAMAARVVLRFINEAPDVNETYGLPPDVPHAAGTVAAEWWDDIAESSYAAAIGKEWEGEVTSSNHVRTSMSDLLAFLEIAVDDPDGNAEVKAAMRDYTRELVSKALDMPPGNARDHLMHRVGASIEAFSIADSRVREQAGIAEEEAKALERKIAGLFLNEIIGKAGPISKPVGFAVGEWLDEVFESEARARELKAGSLQDLQLRHEYKYVVIDQAAERGSISPKELRQLLRFMTGEGASDFDGARGVTDVMDTEGLETLMNGLRSEYLYGEKLREP